VPDDLVGLRPLNQHRNKKIIAIICVFIKWRKVSSRTSLIFRFPYLIKTRKGSSYSTKSLTTVDKAVCMWIKKTKTIFV
jgi:hypothetical protein